MKSALLVPAHVSEKLFAASSTAFRSFTPKEESFRYSLDGGNTFTEEMTIPITGEAELATTGLTAKFTDAEGGDSFMEGDRFTFSTTSPAMSNDR